MAFVPYFVLLLSVFPSKFFQIFNITALDSDIRLILFILFSISIAGLAVHLISFLNQKARRYLFINKGKSRLNVLTEKERNMLRPYFLGKTRTQNFDIFDGASRELESLNILVAYSPIITSITDVPFGISERAYKYLKKRLHLLSPKKVR